jgi:hypothetical protein
MSANSKPASRKAGFGAIPKPTVKSGWEKVEVLQAFKKCNVFECLLGVPSFEFSPSSLGLRVFQFVGTFCLLNLSSLRWISKRREEENEKI